MDMDIQQILKERYAELSPEMQAAIKSNDLAGKFDAIAEKHGLHVDQSGSLQTETLLVMLGIEDSEAYVGNIKRELDISQGEAESLAKDVNEQIFNGIRSSLREISEESVEEEEVVQQSAPEKTIDISSIEKAGGFTVENTEPTRTSPQYKESSLNKESILKGIESDAVPMVDHLLKAATTSAQTVETKKPENVAPISPKPQSKPYTADPYREQL